MNRTARSIFIFIGCALMVILVRQAVPACQVDEFYNTREGSLAATTPEILNEAIKYEEGGNKEKLAALLGNLSVIRLKGDIKIQVSERSVEFKTLKIKLPDSTDTYWVKDGSLKQIKCN